MVQMLELQNKRDKTHLFNLVGRRSGNIPNFALLIGAGASISSGVKSTCEMIAEWRQQLYEHSRSGEPFDKWLQNQEWYNDEEEYSILFEKVYDQRSQRRIFIEECVKDARPSWGYIYLANMIAHNYINVVFTPNFDDLLNEACCTYADCRPMVCAHDSAVVDVRITSARPKIVKLHGDFLYDSIKNTVRETETLEKNMRDKFMQFAREYGLIVVGYGGNDRSVMDILDMVLMSGGNFPNGLYWCIRASDKISKKVERLLRREGSYWVEIDGFDEVMAELHESLGLTLPNLVRDPYKATTERLNRFVSLREKTKHSVIKDDIRELEDQIKRFEQIVSGNAPEEETLKLIPARLLAELIADRNDHKTASLYFDKAIVQSPDDVDLMTTAAYEHIRAGNFLRAIEICETALVKDPNDFDGHYLKGLALLYLERHQDAFASFSEALRHAEEPSREYDLAVTAKSNILLTIGNWEAAFSEAEKASNANPKNLNALGNKCIALKKMGRGEESKRILEDALPKVKEAYTRACFLATLEDKHGMLEALAAAIEDDSFNRIQARSDPDFQGCREDPGFRRLVSGEE